MTIVHSEIWWQDIKQFIRIDGKQQVDGIEFVFHAIIFSDKLLFENWEKWNLFIHKRIDSNLRNIYTQHIFDILKVKLKI